MQQRNSTPYDGKVVGGASMWLGGMDACFPDSTTSVSNGGRVCKGHNYFEVRNEQGEQQIETCPFI